MRILCIDPSGNHGAKEGFGTTGFALFNDGELFDFGSHPSRLYNSDVDYWAGILAQIKSYGPVDAIVCESYKLMGHKAMQQSGSSLDTPQLIGVIRMYCYNCNTKFIFQDPKDKVRVADPILVNMGILEERNGRYYALGRQSVIHERDAIRHGVFFNRYSKHAHNDSNVN